MRWTYALLVAPLLGALLVPDALLDKHVGVLQKTQSLKVTFSVSRVGGATEEQTLSLSRPNKLRWETPSMLVVSDGTNLWTYEKGPKVYSKGDVSDASLQKALGADAVWAWSAFFNGKLGEDVSSAQKGESRKVRNVPVTDLTVTLKDKRVIVLPIDDELGVSRGARYTRPEGETIVLAKELTLGEAALGDELFAWTPPADAKDAAEVKSMATKYADIKPIIDQNCAGCHSGRAPKGGLDFSSYQSIMDSRSIRPGNPDSSRMIREIKSGKMPPAGPLPADQLDKLAKWIADGAVQ